MAGRLVNNEFKRIWTEENFEKNPCRTSGVWTKV
jgi:hypothetical protein